jgi:hypothetical protein
MRSSGLALSIDTLACATIALILFSVALFDPRLLNDGDTYWHIAAGAWMLDHRAVPHLDPFSFTRGGAAWQAHEWLSEVAMALTYRLGGWAGLVALFGVSLFALTVVLAAALRRALTGLTLSVVLIVTLACVAQSLLARPHLLVLPLIVVWTASVVQARHENRAPHPALAAVMVLWANLHGSYVFGFPILGAFGVEALIEAPPAERMATLRRWGGFVALSLAAACLTPQGPMGLIFPFKLMGMSSLSGITEWRPSDFSKVGPFEIALIATVVVALSRGVRVPLVRAALLGVLLHMALQHERHVMVAALVAAVVLAEPLGQALEQRPASPSPSAAWLIAGLLGLALIGFRATLPSVRPDDAVTPAAALDHVPVALRRQPVLNAYDYGGYLISRGVRPFIDGRTDLYGDDFMDRYFQMLRPDPAALDDALRRYHIAWTILPANSPMLPLLEHRPGWRRLYADRIAVVDGIDTPPAAPKTVLP